jgi:molybdopterin converting factor small subunit
MKVPIVIRYYGFLIDQAGRPEETLSVDSDLKTAYPELVRQLSRGHRIDPPYSLLVNNRHVLGAIKAGLELKPHDVIHVYPFLSGG